MTGHGPGGCNISQEPCLKPTRLPLDPSSLCSWQRCPGVSQPVRWRPGAEPRVLFSLSSLLLTESPKFPLRLRTAFVWLSSANRGKFREPAEAPVGSRGKEGGPRG